MSLKPPKKSDLDKQWMRGRQRPNVLFQPEYHLIITEGTKTEPQYFDAIRQVIAFAVPLTEILTLKHGK